jgi:acyl transferase domain-containing protein/acyl carrier protein
MRDLEATNARDIAIIGMSGRFPGAGNVDKFWRNLRDGIESIAFFSDEELDRAGVDSETIGNPSYIKAAGVLEGIELFDAAFFKFSPREAEVLDPQQRIFMECAWEAIEHAGYDPDRYSGLIGVYAGTSMSDYLYQIYAHPELINLIGGFQVGLGNDKDNLTTVVSYKLNLKGPSMAIQTACSTSLVAVSVACNSLLNYECDIALAGGVRVPLPQVSGYFYEEGGIMSPDGHCRAFDAAARGTIGGSGVGVVVLKRLTEALADGDCVHAIIKGCAVNNDGALKVGYTAPSIEGQAQVIASAQAFAGIDPRTITFVEAHGTGTDLGDPIEVAALTQAFRMGTTESQFCAIGSVKTNIGHLDTAAGVAGLIKVVLALKHKAIPPSLNFERPNPNIDFPNSPFYVNTALREWQTNGVPRRAGVNSFGIGGTNAHVIVEEAPAAELSSSSRSEQLLVLSARTGTALENATAKLLEHLKSEPEVDLLDAAYTLQVGRKNFTHRRALVCRDVNEARNALESFDNNVVSHGQASVGASVAFMFPGQGAQHVNMGLDLYREEPTFREQIDLCSQLLAPHLGRDLREVLYPSEGAVAEMTRQLRQTSLAQPALFVVEYALATLLMEWGVRPVAMIGHSLGEYVAACLAGVFTLEDALGLVAARGQMMQQMPAGAMLAVSLSEGDLLPLLKGELCIAAINGPSLCVVSGPFEAVRRLEEELAQRGLEGRPLLTSHAFHSEMMQPILASFTELVAAVKLLPPQMPYLSNRTGEWATAEEATNPEYWANHLRHPVQFADGLESLLSETDAILLEVGPSQTLGSLARRHSARASGRLVLSSMRHMDDPQSDERTLLNALGRLWVSGLLVDWEGFHKHDNCHRTPLPTYPFERQRFWVEADSHGGEGPSEEALSKRPDVADWFYVPTWRRTAPLELSRDKQTMEKSCWILFNDECGLGNRLAQRLEHSGHEFVTVSMGPRFVRQGERSYEINPREREDYQTLFAELRTRGMMPDRIVHLWSVTPQLDGMSTDAYEETQARGFYSLLYLAQALGELPIANARIEVVSNHLQAVTGDEELSPLKATVLGPSLVIPDEYPDISCRSVDVVLPELGGSAESTLIDQLIAELERETSDRVVAYRGHHRWVQDFEQVPLQPAIGTPPHLRDRGVYLITGGLGGIGFTLAEYLAQAVKARLVLVGRSVFPDPAEWEQHLNRNGDSDDSCDKIRQLRALEESGAELMIVSADVADFDAMKRVVEQATQRFGKVQGVIHAAGIAGGRMIQLQSPEVASRVLAPKVLGTLVLNDICKDLDLDFFVVCSSLSSIQGAAGQADYCGANAFLDSFAQGAFARGNAHVVSVNWDAWQEVGMAVNTVVPQDMKASRAESLSQGILPAEGVEALSRILNTRLPQVAVSTMDLLAQLAPSDAASASEIEVEAERIELQHARPSLGNAYVSPRDDQEQAIASLWQELLGIEQVGVHDNFFELGGHSLLAVQFISRLRAAFRTELTLRNLFEFPTVAALAAKVRETHQKSDQETNRMEDVLTMVEQLSGSEVRELLARHGNPLEGD